MNESQNTDANSDLNELPRSNSDDALSQFPLTDKADKVKPPLTVEQKKKVWVRRIIGAIVFFSILGCLALLAAAQAVTFLFKTILSP